MTFLMENARAKKIWFDEDNMWILLIDGRQLSIPKSFFPKFSQVSEDGNVISFSNPLKASSKVILRL